MKLYNNLSYSKKRRNYIHIYDVFDNKDIELIFDIIFSLLISEKILFQFSRGNLDKDEEAIEAELTKIEKSFKDNGGCFEYVWKKGIYSFSASGFIEKDKFFKKNFLAMWNCFQEISIYDETKKICWNQLQNRNEKNIKQFYPRNLRENGKVDLMISKSDDDEIYIDINYDVLDTNEILSFVNKIIN